MNAEVKEVIVELEIQAPIEKVWNAMLNEMAAWWPKNALALEGADEMKFEPWAGGRQYVETADGQQLLWGTVVTIIPKEYVDVVGYTMPQYGGPSTWFWRMAIEDGGEGGTKFRLTNSIVGHVTDESLGDTTEGWNLIFGALKQHCEP